MHVDHRVMVTVQRASTTWVCRDPLGKRARSRLTVRLTPASAKPDGPARQPSSSFAVSPATFPTARSPRASTGGGGCGSTGGGGTETALTFIKASVAGVRERAGIPRSSGTPSYRRAPRRRGSTRARSPRRSALWRADHPLTPWRIWLTDEVRRPVRPNLLEEYLPLD